MPIQTLITCVLIMRAALVVTGLERNGTDKPRVEAEPSTRQYGAAAAAPRDAQGDRAHRDRQHPPREERSFARAGAWRDDARGERGGRGHRADVRDRGPEPERRGHDRGRDARSDHRGARGSGRGERHDRSAACIDFACSAARVAACWTHTLGVCKV